MIGGVRVHPNLFDFAPSELSQDAFLCWLLAHAAPSHWHGRPEIHALGREFLELMFARNSGAPPRLDIRTVKVRRQFKGIDILCVVNDTIAFLIEDKVGTTEHSDQLSIYRRRLEKLGFGRDDKPLVLIYLQTGNQAEYTRVRASGYHVLSRLDLLGLLEGSAGRAAREASDIAEDFYRRLRRIESEVQSFRSTPPLSWSRNARMGFFMALQVEFPEANWRYVPNPSGGFYAFIWHEGKPREDGCKLHLQIEAEDGRLDLCFKVSVPRGGDVAALRTRWQKEVLAAGRRIGVETQRPRRLGRGTTMTVALLIPFAVANADGTIDIVKTVRSMRKAEAILKACVDKPAQDAHALPMPTPADVVEG